MSKTADENPLPIEMGSDVEAEKTAAAVILFGPPGAGKGTQARRVAEHFGIPQIATGDMIRAGIAAGSALGKNVKANLAAGRLVSDDFVNELVTERLRQPDCQRGFLLDGYPRTAEQADVLKETLRRRGQRLVVVQIGIGYNEVVKRITGRRLCPNCGAIFHIHSHPPKVLDVCDACGTSLLTRSDDRAEVVDERLRAYERQTVPVFDVFRKNGQAVHTIDGTLPADEVQQQIFEILKHA